MEEVSLVADILIAITEGINSKKRIKPYYTQFENEFSYDTEILRDNFPATDSNSFVP